MLDRDTLFNLQLEAASFRAAGCSDDDIADWLVVTPDAVPGLAAAAGGRRLECMPTPAEIAQRAAEVRGNWSAYQSGEQWASLAPWPGLEMREAG